MLVTVFTPIYNREKSILAVYNSLCSQTCKDFEWLVINDGSTDRTTEILDHILGHHDNSFIINYVSKPNEGLNRTINKGLDLARGTLFMRLDSDDSALPNAIALIHERYEKIKDNPQLCAIAFRSQHFDGTMVGYHPFKWDTVSDFCSFRHIFHGTGDRNEVMKVEVFRKYKFPELEGEKFCPEALIWNRIAKDYQCVYCPEAIYRKGFEDDSITSKIYLTLKQCCQGSCILYFELLNNRVIPYAERFGAAVRYYRYALFAKRSLWKGIPLKLLPALPIGLFVVFYDRMKHPEAF